MNTSENVFLDIFDIFKSQARIEAFEKGNDKNRKYLEKVIKQAHNFIENKIEEKDLSFDIYNLVLKITDPEKKYLVEFLKNVDTENIKKEDFVTLTNALYSISEDNLSDDI